MKEFDMHEIENNRRFMRSGHGKTDIVSDKEKGLPYPDLFKQSASQEIINLPLEFTDILVKPNIKQCIESRESRRSYSKKQLEIAELSYLLWATQGVKTVIANNVGSYRNVPSGGAKHTFETYIIVLNVKSLKNGLYHYLPNIAGLEYLANYSDIRKSISEAVLDQKFVAEAAAVFVWSCIPYRAEWKYSIAAHKTILLDAGHMCQNLYLACESIGSGTCAIAAYNQDLLDKLIGVDGIDEYAIYLAPVGKIKFA